MSAGVGNNRMAFSTNGNKIGTKNRHKHKIEKK
jgi:hypothetical protein